MIIMLNAVYLILNEQIIHLVYFLFTFGIRHWMNKSELNERQTLPCGAFIVVLLNMQYVMITEYNREKTVEKYRT